MVAMTPDGVYAVTGAHGGTVCVWELSRGGLLANFEPHVGSVRAVAITADGRRVITAGSDRKIHEWHRVLQESTLTIDVSVGDIVGLAVTDDGSRAIISGTKGSPQIWNLESRSVIHSLTDHEYEGWDGAAAVALAADGACALTAAPDGLRVWDVSDSFSFDREHTETHEQFITNIVATKSGKIITFTGKEIVTFESSSGEIVSAIQPSHRYFEGVSGDGHKVLVADEYGFEIWNLVTSERIGRAIEPDLLHSMRAGFVISYDGTKVIVADMEAGAGVHLYRLTSKGSFMHYVLVDSSPAVRALQAAADDSILIAFETGELGKVDLNTLEPKILMRQRLPERLTYGNYMHGDDYYDSSVGEVIFSHSGRTVMLEHKGSVEVFVLDDATQWHFSGSFMYGRYFKAERAIPRLEEPDDHLIEEWDVLAERLIYIEETHERLEYLRDMQVSADGRHGLTCAETGTSAIVEIWDLRERILRFRLADEYSEVLPPDGTYIITQAKYPKQSLRLWNISDGVHLTTLKTHERVTCIAVSPAEPHRMFFGYRDGTVARVDIFAGTPSTSGEAHAPSRLGVI